MIWRKRSQPWAEGPVMTAKEELSMLAMTPLWLLIYTVLFGFLVIDDQLFPGQEE